MRRLGTLAAAGLLLFSFVSARAAEPVRVATLLPWVEDALRTVPDHATVVAAVRRDLRQPVPEPTLDLGNPHSPSFEALAQARPELVIGDAALHARDAVRLGRGGVEVMLVETPGVAATFDALRQIGARVGAADELDAAVAEAEREIERLVVDRPIPVLAVFGAPGRFFAMTDETWLGDLLARLGFQNVVEPPESPLGRYPGLVPLGDEAVASLRPELVLVVAHGEPERIRRAFEEKIASGGPWKGIRESSGGRVRALDPDLFATNPGLGIPKAARALVEGARPVVEARR